MSDRDKHFSRRRILVVNLAQELSAVNNNRPAGIRNVHLDPSADNTGDDVIVFNFEGRTEDVRLRVKEILALQQLIKENQRVLQALEELTSYMEIQRAAKAQREDRNLWIGHDDFLAEMSKVFREPPSDGT